MTYRISYEALMEAVTTTDPLDMTPQIQAGDWIIIPRNSASYQEAHVETVIDPDKFTATFGGKETPREWRFGATFGYTYSPREVSEIWRRRRVSKRSTFMYQGQPSEVISSEYEWYRVWADERYQPTVSWWAE